jgi:1-pyrroline-5-carboxylate dehydrogenase
VASLRIGGITFTGSYQVGRQIMQRLAGESRPAICEMGGKNPAYVAASADLSQAAEGVARAAFGYSGQKCSACSRAFVHRDHYEEFKELLLAKTGELVVGDPSGDVFTGPLISPAAMTRFESVVEGVRQSGGQILAGGERLKDGPLDRGFYAALTVAEVPETSEVWNTELFLPLVTIASVAGLDEAIARANDTEYGLTAGIYSSDEREIERYFDAVEASVIYANRRSGATTGAWPGMQPISGWKASGSTGKGTGGPYYIQQYMREQSRTIVSA